MNEVNQEKIIDFFESYETIYKLHQGNQNCFIKVYISKTKSSIVSIKVIEKIKNKSDNLFCDLKMDGNKTTMIFKLNKEKPVDHDTLKSLSKNNISIIPLSLTVKVVLMNPTVSDIRRIFVFLEKHCRRREED